MATTAAGSSPLPEVKQLKAESIHGIPKVIGNTWAGVKGMHSLDGPVVWMGEMLGGARYFQGYQNQQAADLVKVVLKFAEFCCQPGSVLTN